MKYLPFVLVLAACNAPTFEFRDAPVQRVHVGKSTFDVRVKDNQAQAIRVNMEWAPNWSHTAARFKVAFEVASGCKVRDRSMVGDQALMQARLNCTGRAPGHIPRRHGGYDCEITQSDRPPETILCEEVIPVAIP